MPRTPVRKDSIRFAQNCAPLVATPPVALVMLARRFRAGDRSSRAT